MPAEDARIRWSIRWATPPSRSACARAYAEAYRDFFAEHLPDNGVPCRFTVHLLDVPDRAASYEFYATALYQKTLQKR